MELAYEEAGNREGPPLVLLHGFPLDRRQWAPQVGPLTEAGYRVVLPDLRGHGRSTTPDGIITMTQCALDVLALCDRLGLERFTLGGFSMGGYAALELARHAPDRLEGLLLADTRADPDTSDARAGRLNLARTVEAQGMAPLIEAMMPKFFTAATRQDRPDLVERVLGIMRTTKPHNAANALRGMADRRDQRDLLPRLDVATLVLVGAQDPLTDVAASRAMHERLPRSEFHVVEDAAHLAPMERPDDVNARLGRWLGTLHATA